MNVLGERIAQRRKELGMSQEDLALLMQTHQRQISRYETGQNDPTVRVLIAIAQALDTTPTWLLGLSDNPERPLTEDNLTEDERTLLELFRSKEPTRRHSILEILKLV